MAEQITSPLELPTLEGAVSAELTSTSARATALTGVSKARRTSDETFIADVHAGNSALSALNTQADAELVGRTQRVNDAYDKLQGAEEHLQNLAGNPRVYNNLMTLLGNSDFSVSKASLQVRDAESDVVRETSGITQLQATTRRRQASIKAVMDGRRNVHDTQTARFRNEVETIQALGAEQTRLTNLVFKTTGERRQAELHTITMKENALDKVSDAELVSSGKQAQTGPVMLQGQNFTAQEIDDELMTRREADITLANHELALEKGKQELADANLERFIGTRNLGQLDTIRANDYKVQGPPDAEGNVKTIQLPVEKVEAAFTDRLKFQNSRVEDNMDIRKNVYELNQMLPRVNRTLQAEQNVFGGVSAKTQEDIGFIKQIYNAAQQQIQSGKKSRAEIDALLEGTIKQANDVFKASQERILASTPEKQKEHIKAVMEGVNSNTTAAADYLTDNLGTSSMNGLREGSIWQKSWEHGQFIALNTMNKKNNLAEINFADFKNNKDALMAHVLSSAKGKVKPEDVMHMGIQATRSKFITERNLTAIDAALNTAVDESGATLRQLTGIDASIAMRPHPTKKGVVQFDPTVLLGRLQAAAPGASLDNQFISILLDEGFKSKLQLQLESDAQSAAGKALNSAVLGNNVMQDYDMRWRIYQQEYQRKFAQTKEEQAFETRQNALVTHMSTLLNSGVMLRMPAGDQTILNTSIDTLIQAMQQLVPNPDELQKARSNIGQAIVGSGAQVP